MGFKRMLRWMVLALMPLFLFTGCGDLAPEMQDTRTVMLKMDLRQNSSLRRSQVSAADLSAYNTHLIMVLPSWERLSSDYRNYYNIFAEELMDPVSKQVSLEIPLNTQLNIFAFLFKENYSKYDLFTAIKEVGYYGESPSFSITGETNNLSLAVSLTQVPGTDTETDTETDTDTGTDTGTDTTAPVLTEVTAISSPTSDSTPDYTFKSTEAGIISYGGLCSSVRTAAISGDNIIIFDYLIDGNYPDCTITVTDSAGNISIPLPVTNFTVDTSSSNTDTTAPALTEVTAISSPTSDSTPDYTFKSTEAGTISYGGSCESDSHTYAISGDNIITFNTLTAGTYSDCTITVTDSAGNISTPLSVTDFTVMDPSLEAFYPFNGNAEDITSNGRDLTVTGDTSLTFGKDNSSNSAYYFDGNGDYLEYVTNIPSFDNYTISLWAKPASSGTYEAMFSSYDNSNNGFQIDLNGNNFHIRKSSGGNIVLSTAQLEVWTFIAFTYDGTNSIGYINSVSDNESSGGTTEFNRFRIGRNRDGSTYFSGAIDELRIYNRALTASEIASLYAN
ncbi:MAG: LamG domain-containing protein [Deltaproteobacteria bacterium]|nr:LamG domain-containing protein [Deltaproteobacteria bacterium]